MSAGRPLAAADLATALKALDHVALLEDEAREAWLEALARRDPPLAAKVRALAAGAERMADLDHGPDLLADHLTAAAAILPVGTRLGAWRLTELLGSGGMGRVYRAERADGAFEKQVAIKVLRQERRLPDAIIERERALLARLEHPGVTRLLDGGISADGDIFLVMEQVDGETLDAWCGQPSRRLDARLDVFEQILDALAHAHGQLVVHGDLKPANILVDTRGRARILDFGVAQLLGSTAPAGTQATTPGWSAPECRAGEPPRVASDIFNLGLLLKYLASTPAAERVRRLPRDLAAIIEKATTSAAERRYGTVVELHADLTSYRRRRPVQARHGGRIYRLTRFVRRHWFGVGFAATVTTLLIGAATLFVWQDRLVRSERDAAQVAAARSQTVLDYLLGLVGEAGQRDAPASLQTLLADSLGRIETDFQGDPSARQALLAHLGELLTRLGDFRSAETVLEAFRDGVSAGTSPRLHARALDNLAVVRLHQGRVADAEQLVTRALAMLARSRADDRATRSELLVTRAQIEAKQGPQGAAITTLRDALSLRLAVSSPDDAQTVVVRNSLAIALMGEGSYEQALRQFRQIDAALTSSRRDHSLDAATIYANHASVAFAYGRYREADKGYVKALALQEELYGPSVRHAALLNNAGKLDIALGNLARGSDRIQRALAMMQRFAGSDSLDVQLVGLGLGTVAMAEQRPADAAAIFAAAATRLGATLGVEHPLVRQAQAHALVARAHAGAIGADDHRFDRLAAQLGESTGGQRPLAQLQCDRAHLALLAGLPALARDSAAACLAIRATSTHADGPPRLIAALLLASAEARMQPDADHRARRDAALTRLQESLGPDHPQVQRLAAL